MRTDDGKALLETDELRFRGARARVRVRFPTIGAMVVDGEWLRIAHAGGALALSLGRRAPLWLEKIHAPKGIVGKLGVPARARVALVSAPEDDVEGGLVAAGARVSRGAPRGEVDVILYGVEAARGLSRVGALATKLAPGGALWIVRPGGKGGVQEEAVRAAGAAAGLVDVKVARYYETHTAEKFVRRRGGRS